MKYVWQQHKKRPAYRKETVLKAGQKLDNFSFSYINKLKGVFYFYED